MKVVHGGDDPQRLARLAREAQLAATIKHDNVIAIMRRQRGRNRVPLHRHGVHPRRGPPRAQRALRRSRVGAPGPRADRRRARRDPRAWHRAPRPEAGQHPRPRATEGRDADPEDLRFRYRAGRPLEPHHRPATAETGRLPAAAAADDPGRLVADADGRGHGDPALHGPRSDRRGARRDPRDRHVRLRRDRLRASHPPPPLPRLTCFLAARRRERSPAPPLESLRADIPFEVARVVERCLAFAPEGRPTARHVYAILSGARPSSTLTEASPPR